MTRYIFPINHNISDLFKNKELIFIKIRIVATFRREEGYGRKEHSGASDALARSYLYMYVICICTLLYVCYVSL